jgi:hypothetical protein
MIFVIGEATVPTVDGDGHSGGDPRGTPPSPNDQGRELLMIALPVKTLSYHTTIIIRLLHFMDA